jgi:hypothetical protein
MAMCLCLVSAGDLDCLPQTSMPLGARAADFHLANDLVHRGVQKNSPYAWNRGSVACGQRRMNLLSAPVH